MSKKKPSHRPGGLKIIQTWIDEAEQVIPSSITNDFPEELKVFLSEHAKGVQLGQGSGPNDPKVMKRMDEELRAKLKKKKQ